MKIIPYKTLALEIIQNKNVNKFYNFISSFKILTLIFDSRCFLKNINYKPYSERLKILLLSIEIKSQNIYIFRYLIILLSSIMSALVFNDVGLKWVLETKKPSSLSLSMTSNIGGALVFRFLQTLWIS